jgi:molybdopterin converting factor subunit 1
MKKIHVQYFAILREQRGVAEEALTTSATTADEFYEELKARHSFTLQSSRLRVAINGEFVPWTTLLQDGATVVFIPPVAGG